MKNRSNHNFRKLNAWTHSIELVTEIYKVIHEIPAKNNYGLMDQIKRAAVSIPSNIAEGSGRGTDPDFIRHLYIAKGSIAELISLFTISSRLDLISIDAEEAMIEKLVHIDNMIFKLIHKLDQPAP